MMDQVLPWREWLAVIEPFYYHNTKGRPAVGLETMLRMYLVQCWFNLSDEACEDAVCDWMSVRRFMGLDAGRDKAPDATTLCQFRHLLEKHQLGQALLAEQNRVFEAKGLVVRGGTVVDATIVAAPSSTKNRDRARDPEMRQTKKGNQYYFGLKAHIGVGARDGYVHSLTVTAANESDVCQAVNLIRGDDEVVWADAGYVGLGKRDEILDDEHLAQVDYRVGMRKSKLAGLNWFDRALESAKASVRAIVEHPFLILKREFGYVKTRYKGLAKNTERVAVLFASSNLLMRARALRLGSLA